MEMENKYASRGVAGTALGLGIGAVGVELLRGGLGNILGGNEERHSTSQQARIAELDSEVKLLKSNIYTDAKLLEVYKYFDGETKQIREELAAQAVKNAQIEGTFAVIGEKIAANRNEFMCALNREKDERCCGDTAIVNYANATFYPKLVADVTVGTTTTAQSLYNPIPGCNCCK
jgi:hypothetical protein